VLLEGLTQPSSPEVVTKRLRDAVAEPVELTEADGRAVAVTASIGIALGQRGTADDLFRDADFALYEAKGAGKNRWALFESRMLTAAQDRLALR